MSKVIFLVTILVVAYLSGPVDCQTILRLGEAKHTTKCYNSSKDFEMGVESPCFGSCPSYPDDNGGAASSVGCLLTISGTLIFVPGSVRNAATMYWGDGRSYQWSYTRQQVPLITNHAYGSSAAYMVSLDTFSLFTTKVGPGTDHFIWCGSRQTIPWNITRCP
jgi:hypothetical protein